MKAFLTAVAFFYLVFPVWAAEQSPNTVIGCVLYKPASAAWASVVEYRSYRDFGTNITVIDQAGVEVRIFGGQEPIFIPYPSDPSADPQAVNALIKQARERYPERKQRLAVIEKAWAAVPRKSVVPVAPAPVPQVQAAQEKTGMEIVTTTGKKFENVTISRVEPDGLMVMTDAGVQKIPFVSLSPELQKKYGYNPQAAAAFTAVLAVAQKENAMRAQQVREVEQRKVMEQAKAEEARRVAAAEAAAKAPKILRDARGKIVSASLGEIATNAFTLENCVVELPLLGVRARKIQEVAAGVYEVELRDVSSSGEISGTATREQAAWIGQAAQAASGLAGSSLFVLISKPDKYFTKIQFLGNTLSGGGFGWNFQTTR